LLKTFPADRWYKWALYDRDPLERWSKGRVTLLGVPRTPCCLQGAATAIEDACVLSAAIARHADVLDQALLAYERLPGAAREGGRARSARASPRESSRLALGPAQTRT